MTTYIVVLVGEESKKNSIVSCTFLSQPRVNPPATYIRNSPTRTYTGRGCASGPGPDSSSRCLLATHSRMDVLLIFILFSNSGSSLSNATSLAEMTAITKVSRAGKPSSLRFLSTVHDSESESAN